MADPVPAYALRAELKGHVEDVRGCTSCELGIVTASRDKTVRLWVEDGPSAYTCLNTFIGHRDYVGPVAYLAAGVSPDYQEAAIVSGSRDTTLMVWDPATAQAIATLTGHSYQVTALGVLPSGEIVSGALDKTVRVWRGGKCLRVLEGHEGPVLSLAVLPSGDVLSGSGDTTIRQWAGATATCSRVYRGHTDTVRGMAALPDGDGFVSVSHDCTGKVWTLGGQVVAELIGHTALVYAVATTRGGLLATGSEDNTSRIWTINGQCLQVLDHIGCVWAVAFTADSDLITACADSIARVWTAREENKAPAEVAAAYHQALTEIKAQRAAAAAESATGDAAGGGGGAGGGTPGLPPGVKVVEAHTLQQPGATDGQVKVVRETNGAVNAYSWNMTAWEWEKVGEVQEAPVGGAGTTLKKGYKGKEWDFVIDVETDDGPPKKLALNRGDNPYLVADAFIEEEGLPPHFRDQIVQFIIQNTDAKEPSASLAGMPITGGFCDPLTGGGSGGAQEPAPMQWQQQPAVALSSLDVTGGHFDPFTGGSRSQPAQPAQPMYLLFNAVPPMDKLATKVRELSGQLNGIAAPLALSEAEAAVGLQGLLSAAASAASTATPAPAVSLPPELVALLAKMLTWPPAQVFPALDVARLLALHPQAAAAVAPLAQADGPLSLALTAAAASDVVAAQQVALRVLCNAFKQPALRAWATGTCGEHLDAWAAAGSATAPKAVRLGWATLLYNYAVSATQPGQASTEEVKLQVLSALVELSSSCPLDDGASAARALSAIALLLGADKSLGQVAKDLGVQELLKRVHDAPESKTPEGRPVLEAAISVMNCLK